MTNFSIEKEAEVLGLRDSLKRKATTLAKLDEEILAVIADDDIVDEIEACEKVQEAIDLKVSEIDVMLKRARNVKKGEASSEDTKSTHEAVTLEA